MAFCTQCGTEMEGTVCPACGAGEETTQVVPLAQVAQQTPPPPPQPQPSAYAPPQYAPVPPQYPPYPQYPVYPVAYYPQPEEDDDDAVVSVGAWIGRRLFLLIPCVGPLVYFILLFVWAGDDSREESSRNWAKAQLWVLLFLMLLSLIAMFLFLLI